MIDLQNIKKTHPQVLASILSQDDLMTDFLTKIKASNQGFWTAEVLSDSHENIKDFYKTNKDKFEQVVVLGVGGSALGAKVLLSLAKNKKLRILDNIDPDFVYEQSKDLDLKKTLFLVISKSGGTIETIAHYLYFAEQIKRLGRKMADHFVFIGDDNLAGFLQLECQRHNCQFFPMPKNVGGRFSVLTVVGLLPALFMEIDINELLLGARERQAEFLSAKASENSAFILASLQYQFYQQGKNENVFYAYANALQGFLDWQKQLLAESIGKNGQGITPLTAIGTSDQHSQNQLYFDGPANKFFIFLEITKKNHDLTLAKNDLVGSSMAELVRLSKKGSEGALTQKGLPNITISLPQLDAKNLGKLFFLFEAATAFLGEHFGIDAFDQPAVELSKKITKELLSKDFACE